MNSYQRQVATSNFAERTWFLSPVLAGGNGPCARGAHQLGDSTCCACSHSPIPTQ